MKIFFSVLLALFCFTAWCQQDSTANHSGAKNTTYARHSILATVSLGFMDMYRTNYSVPSGFAKGNTSGFLPIYVKLEYGLTPNISLAATMCYDAFIYNFKQNYMGNNGPFTRYRNSTTRIFSGGLTAFYHLGRFMPSKHWDPFIGLGISLNNIRYSSYPQGDSTLIKIDHTVTPYLKAGARYYISPKFSLFGDAGYDQQSIFSIGASCRFAGNKRASK